MDEIPGQDLVEGAGTEIVEIIGDSGLFHGFEPDIIVESLAPGIVKSAILIGFQDRPGRLSGHLGPAGLPAASHPLRASYI